LLNIPTIALEIGKKPYIFVISELIRRGKKLFLNRIQPERWTVKPNSIRVFRDRIRARIRFTVDPGSRDETSRDITTNNSRQSQRRRRRHRRKSKRHRMTSQPMRIFTVKYLLMSCGDFTTKKKLD
jgi:hypothetical protein